MIYEAVDLTRVYEAVDLTYSYEPMDHTSTFDAIEFWYRIATHGHSIAIPGGEINGINLEFIVSGTEIEVLLNGLNVPYVKTETGFTLSEAPQAGDILWCEVITET